MPSLPAKPTPETTPPAPSPPKPPVVEPPSLPSAPPIVEPPSLAALLETTLPRVLPEPPWSHAAPLPIEIQEPGPAPVLALVSDAKNEIIDEAAWVERVGMPALTWGIPDELPPHVPTQYAGFDLRLAIADPEQPIFGYAGGMGGLALVVTQRSQAVLGAFDLSAWQRAPNPRSGEAAYTEAEVFWAEVVDDVLYLSTAHRTYAKSSRGMNAFVSAIDLPSGQLRWRSAPLVANSRNFVIHGGYLFTGYGFTAEPDFVYVLDRRDGTEVSRTKVASGPDLFFERDGQLLVRTYDRDYVFDIRAGGASKK